MFSDYMHSDTSYFVGLRVESVSMLTSLLVCTSFNHGLITVPFDTLVLRFDEKMSPIWNSVLDNRVYFSFKWSTLVTSH